jgi:hypothetical protein
MCQVTGSNSPKLVVCSPILDGHSQRMLEGFITKQAGVAIMLYIFVWEVLG